jgi:hypothetical protein
MAFSSLFAGKGLENCSRRGPEKTGPALQAYDARHRLLLPVENIPAVFRRNALSFLPFAALFL